MHYGIDISGKLEQTNTPTILSFTNERSGSVLLGSNNKKSLQKFYRDMNKADVYTIQTYSILLYILINTFSLKKNIIVDIEYQGHENLIRYYLTKISNQKDKEPLSKHDLLFEYIGKASKAHYIANRSYKSRKAEISITAKEIIELRKHIK